MLPMFALPARRDAVAASVNPQVVGSSPTRGASLFCYPFLQLARSSGRAFVFYGDRNWKSPRVGIGPRDTQLAPSRRPAPGEG